MLVIYADITHFPRGVVDSRKTEVRFDTAQGVSECDAVSCL